MILIFPPHGATICMVAKPVSNEQKELTAIYDIDTSINQFLKKWFIPTPMLKNSHYMEHTV